MTFRIRPALVLTVTAGLLLLALESPRAGAGTRCSSLESCLARLRGQASVQDRPSSDILATAASLQRYGDAAVRKLLSMVERREPEEVREIAAFVLGTFPPLKTPEQRESFRRAVREGVCAATGPASRFAVPADIPSFVSLIRRHCKPAVAALASLGHDGKRALVEALGDPFVSDEMGEAIRDQVQRLPCEEKIHITPILGAILNDEGRAAGARARTAYALGSAIKCEETLALALRQCLGLHDHSVRRACMTILVASKDSAVVPALIEEAKAGYVDVEILWALKEFAPATRNAVTAVAGYLKSGPWDYRCRAARLLGLLGGQEAEKALLGVLAGPSWVETYCAVQALDCMPASKAAEAPLGQTAARHWFGPVRQAAANAQIHVATGQGGRPSDSPAAAVAACEASPRDILTNSTWKGCGQFPRRSIPWVPNSNRESVAAVLETDDGWFIGTDRGEFGGELRFRSKLGQTSGLIAGDSYNVRWIVRLGEMVVAAAYRDELSTLFYRLDNWTRSAPCVPWLDLPGSPIRVEGRRDRIVAETGQGVFEIFADGTIREGSCASWSGDLPAGPAKAK
jgi:hypothetical protein